MGWGASSCAPWGPPPLEVFPRPSLPQSPPSADTFTSAHPPPPSVTLGSGGSPIPPEGSLRSHAQAATLSSRPWREEDCSARKGNNWGGGWPSGVRGRPVLPPAPPTLSSDSLETTGHAPALAHSLTLAHRELPSSAWLGAACSGGVGGPRPLEAAGRSQADAGAEEAEARPWRAQMWPVHGARGWRSPWQRGGGGQGGRGSGVVSPEASAAGVCSWSPRLGWSQENT